MAILATMGHSPTDAASAMRAARRWRAVGGGAFSAV